MATFDSLMEQNLLENIMGERRKCFLKNLFKNIMGKGETAGNQHFLLFPHCFKATKNKNNVTRSIFLSHLFYPSPARVA